MKKVTIIFLSLALVTMMSFSASAEIKMSAGLKAGLGIANLMGKTIKDMDDAIKADGGSSNSRLGFTAYGFFTTQFMDYIAAQIELGYAMKGKQYKQGDYKMEYNADYFEVPILVKGMLPLGSVTPFVYVGPSLDFLLSSKMKMTGGGTTTTTDNKSNTEGFDFGLAMGAGANLTVGPGAILLDLRYTLGLSNIAKKAAGETDTPEVKNGVFGIMVGYGINL